MSDPGEPVIKPLYRVKEGKVVVKLMMVVRAGEKIAPLTPSLYENFIKQCTLKIGTDVGEVIYKLDEEEFTVREETASFIRPSWRLLNKIEGSSTGFRPDGIRELDLGSFAYNRLRYCLKETTMGKVVLGRDGQGDEWIANIDELTGPQGLNPKVINMLLAEWETEL